MGKKHPAEVGLPAAPPAPAPTDGDEDPRVIDEECPTCGQRFRWQPAFTTHKRTCTGPRA